MTWEESQKVSPYLRHALFPIFQNLVSCLAVSCLQKQLHSKALSQRQCFYYILLYILLYIFWPLMGNCFLVPYWQMAIAFENNLYVFLLLKMNIMQAKM